ncbi:MAG TPA: hypothetical protein VKS81_01080 [Bacteroidota bacterium]|nr:hypothetical protein [Bacteroidota bacterium]
MLIIALLPLACTPTYYSYRASTNACNCEVFHSADPAYNVRYVFRAQYSMQDGINTEITILFHNRTKDTLQLDPGAIRVSSSNVSYEYNGRFLPLPTLSVRPGKTDSISVQGKDIKVIDDEWNKIAGEQLTITLKGMRLGTHELAEQSVTFVPKNPKMGS